MIKKIQDHLSEFIVPIIFLGLCAIGVIYSEQSPGFIINTIIERLGRNCFLVISLIIPVVAGIGLNFSIVLGAMAAQIGLIFAIDWGFAGIWGIVMAAALSTVFSVLFGYFVGLIFNRAKGREMVTGLITGFFANGIYQMVFLYGAGTFLTILTQDLLLPRGQNEAGETLYFGLQNTINLENVQYAIDDLIPLPAFINNALPDDIFLPIFPFVLIALACLFVVFFLKTKLGQEMKAMGHNQHISEISGIKVNRNRIIAIIISTIMAGYGQILFLQNIGTITTYNSHEYVGMFAIAALLVSGATVSKASVLNAIFGTFLFHTLFFTSPLAGKNIFGNVVLGEYFRVFVAYGVIAIALALHAWKTTRQNAIKAEEC